MNGLNVKQEAALVYAWMRQEAGARDFTDLGSQKHLSH